MTCKLRRYLHGQRPGRIQLGIRGGPFGTVLSALFDDDTQDVLLFARETRGRFRGRAVGGPWLGRLVRYSVYLLTTTRKMCRYLHGKRAWRAVGGPFGMVLCVLFDEDTHDMLLFTR